MKMVMKANKQLRVDDARVDELKELGYREISPQTGEYLEQDGVEDKRKDSTVKKENAELKKQVAELTAKLAETAPPIT